MGEAGEFAKRMIVELPTRPRVSSRSEIQGGLVGERVSGGSNYRIEPKNGLDRKEKTERY
jgi:hypothetical protein